METTNKLPMYGNQKDMETLEPGLYLALYHGFSSHELRTATDGWGDNGPLIGPLVNYHGTYIFDLKIEFESLERARFYGFDNEIAHLTYDDDCIQFQNMYYGDYVLFNVNVKPKPEKIYTVIDLGGGLIQDICTFSDEGLANHIFIKWMNETYGTSFKDHEVEEAIEYNSEQENSKYDIRYMETELDKMPESILDENPSGNGIPITKAQAEAFLAESILGNVLAPGRSIMCKEYGDDDDWCEVTADDLNADGTLDEDYQTFEIW